MASTTPTDIPVHDGNPAEKENKPAKQKQPKQPKQPKPSQAPKAKQAPKQATKQDGAKEIGITVCLSDLLIFLLQDSH